MPTHAALERLLARAEGAEEKAVAEEIRRLVETVERLRAPSAPAPKGKTTVAANLALLEPRDRALAALVEAGFTYLDLAELTWGHVGATADGGFQIRTPVGEDVVALPAGSAGAQALRDVMVWGWSATLTGGATPDPAWPLVTSRPGAARHLTAQGVYAAVRRDEIRRQRQAAATPASAVTPAPTRMVV